MHDAKDNVLLKEGAGLAALVLMTLFFFSKNSDVHEAVTHARNTRASIQRDEDLYRSDPMLGETYAILEKIRRELPEDTSISIPKDNRYTGQIQRFWITLLPQYPIRKKADYVICSRDNILPGDQELEQGGPFVLVRRPIGK